MSPSCSQFIAYHFVCLLSLFLMIYNCFLYLEMFVSVDYCQCTFSFMNTLWFINVTSLWALPPPSAVLWAPCSSHWWWPMTVWPHQQKTTSQILSNDERAYREEVEHLADWCSKNNLCGENKGSYCGLQKEPALSLSTANQQQTCGGGGQHKVSVYSCRLEEHPERWWQQRKLLNNL